MLDEMRYLNCLRVDKDHDGLPNCIGFIDAVSCGEFEKLKQEACRQFEQLDTGIKIAQTAADIERVIDFVAADYADSFPQLQPKHSDDYIVNSFNFYSEDEFGNVNGTISLVMDSERGFPEEFVFKDDIEHYRQAGHLIFELGRFVVADGVNGYKLAMSLLQVLYVLPKLVRGSLVLGMVRPKDVKLHEKRFGAKVLQRNTGVSYGSAHQFASVAWEIDKLTPLFFSKTGCSRLIDLGML